MDDFIFTKKQETTSGEHKDLKRNYSWANQWIKQYEKEFPKSLSVSLGQTLVMFNFSPHKRCPIPSFSNPVALSQDYEIVKREVDQTYGKYCALVKKYLYKFAEEINVWEKDDKSLFEKLVNKVTK